MPDDAVYVGRPSRWGNPFRVERTEYPDHFCYRVTDGHRFVHDHIDTERDAHRIAVDLFNLHIGPMGSYEYADETLKALQGLAGRPLACWCPLGYPCHADVLARFAVELTSA